MQIKEVQSHEEISSTYEVLKQIYHNLNPETYVDNILHMMKKGYMMAAVFEDGNSDKGKCIGVVGIRITKKLQHGMVVEIEDFMICLDRRNIGVGKMLIRWVEWQAANFECNTIIGNLETKRESSQRIYAREKFIIDGLSFKKTA